MDRTAKQRRRAKVEFGDFQTPLPLATRICQRLAQLKLKPCAILEPTCGLGHLLFAAADTFPEASQLAGIDLNLDYVKIAQIRLAQRPDRSRFRLLCRDVFQFEPTTLLSGSSEPWLIIGNPPWVTSAVLGGLGSQNVPPKCNSDGRRGIDAITGSSNFDVSEWILRRIATLLNGRTGTMAMLCKTSVARKLLGFAWRHQFQLHSAALYEFDANLEFGASVDACLLVCHFQPGGAASEAEIYPSLESSLPRATIGWRGERLVMKLPDAAPAQHLQATEPSKRYIWRSGIKHDCALILELEERDGQFWNGLGDPVAIEPEYLYPLLKSSDVANGSVREPRRWIVMPQRQMRDDTADLERRAPRTWNYLVRHGARLDGRRSSVYRRRPRFSLFGLGDYTFAPWKVAISGFYKSLQFRVVASYRDRPLILDDTCYFIACDSAAEALQVATALNSDPALDFLKTFIFWDSKRPITAEVLRHLDIEKLIALLASSDSRS